MPVKPYHACSISSKVSSDIESELESIIKSMQLTLNKILASKKPIGKHQINIFNA